jgi:hypothetical protein
MNMMKKSSIALPSTAKKKKKANKNKEKTQFWK